MNSPPISPRRARRPTPHRRTRPRPTPLRTPRGAAQSATPAPDTPSPLTALQRAFLTTEALYEGVTAHGYLRQTVRGPLDAGLLGLALAAVAARHPMLRLRVTGGTSPRQYTAPAGPADRAPDWYEVHEPGDRTDPGRVLADLEQHLYNRPFDLTAESPVRAVLVRDHRDPHLAHLLLAVHHGAADGFSLKILCEDLWSLYTAFAEGRPVSELPLPQADFADHIALADAQRRSAGFARDQRYWRDRLARHTPREAARALPYDADPDTPPAPPFTHHQTTLDPALGAALRDVAARHEVSLFHLLLAAYTRCLSRWGGGPSVAVNVARARREAPLPGIERLVGPLADTLPVLVAVGADEPLPALARRLRGIWREAEAHGSLTSPDIAALLPSGGAAPRTAAAAGFSFARFPVRHGLGRPVEVTPAAAATASAATRLSLLCWEADAALHFSWNHPARLFHRETVERLAAEYSAELRRVAEEFGATGQESGGAGIVARLSARFRAAAGSVAVDTGDTTLTYAELDTASAALAARLRAHGVRPGDLVGLLTERGADTVLGVVGILRAGAGWVPLDPSHPAARLQEQLTRTGARTVVCHAATRATAAALDGVSPVPADAPGPAPAAGLPDVPTDPDALAYVIFTSGSTGRPKAVPITHRSLLAYLDWALTAFGYHAGDRLLQTASPCFDASVRQLLAPLLVGARVHTLTQDDLRDPDTLLDRVVNDRITVWSSVPTLWERLITAAELRAPREGAPPDLSALRWVHVGGEALPPAHVRRWFDLLGDRAGAGHRVSNLYGPTEATINATCHIIDARPGDDVRTLPIGRPVAGTELAVVDEEGHPCAPGEEGHLLIAGTGLTPGYLGEPGLTEAAFTERDGRRWYRSGDRVRRTDDGVLEYLGRLDDQVKVRGHRVEPGEVEAALLTLPDVARAAVLLVGGRLAAYLEPRAGAAGPDARAVRAALARTLPPYMVPGRVHTLAAMPLTGTGKIDRTRLPHRPGDHTRPGGDDHSGADDRSGPAAGDHDGSAVGGHDGPAPGELGGPATGRQGIPASGDHDNPAAGGHDDPAAGGHDAQATPRPGPATPTEQLLARVWSDLLDVPEVARDDDFFQLGGDSIMVLELFARLRAELPRVPRPTTLYTHRTLAALATALDAAHTADPAPVDRTPPTPADAPYPLTPSQRGFLLAEAVDPGAAPVWLARFRLSGPLRPDVLQRAVDVLVARHPMLRTVFPAGARPPVQQELPASLRLPVQRETLTGGPARLEQRIAEEARRELEPWAWPLLRLRLFTLAADEHVLLVHAHHLIGDGYSAALLARELLTAYGNLEHGRPHGLPPLTGTFRDHVTRSAARQRPHGPDADAHRARLREPYTPPVLRAPAAGESASRQGFHTSGFTLDAAATRAVRRLARAAGTTAHAPLLTAYYQALAELTGQRDLMVGLAVTGREDSTPDAHRVFGPFAQAVTLRPSPPSGPRQERTPAFADDVRLLAAESALARTEGPSAPRTASGLPRHAQFFFTFLDFTSLGPVGGGGPTLRTDDSDTSLAPPPLGTDVFLAARPLSGDAGLRVTLRASAAALTDRQARDLAEDIRRRLLDGAAGPARAPRRTGLDAALVGYLPSPRDLAAFAGLPDGIPGLGREEIRASLFPDGRARLLERTGTPLGESGFVALPLFADELAGAGDLAARTARAVEHAASLGARSVSLAGMIPSLTGYGHDVLRESGTRAAITTGHATTTVAVARTVRAALAASGRDLGDLTLAVVGCGSIGVSSLRLLLATSPRPPARLLLCDLPGGADRLRRLAADLSRAHPATPVRVVESGRRLPAEAYEADVLVTAVSGAGNLVDVARLRPGTVLVDDSFPHCFDTARALDRMSTAGDVLVLGGGLLALDSTATRLSEDLPPAAATGFAARPAIADTLASCRLESLLHAHLADRPGRLAPVHGLVDLPRALAHWDAAEAAGVRAAPLHLLDRVLADADGRHVRRADSSPAPDRGGSPCR
ncbi:polyketide synthase [Streptomyces zinciresistens K42]|uniref:Polyketide synthase n=1 Tax=Streptomyces zinciresistens K42 TaxID=700597 RepID=G2GH90_9ACTN|nr:polyketide synthase [Streptomyces zinciresistens K42]